MNEALAFYAIRTVPAFPLGVPEDGRPRYGMTPEMACAYRWLVDHKPHEAPFGINFRETAWKMARHGGAMHATVQGLVERGWIEKAEVRGSETTYQFVRPVMTFKAPRHG
jgi:hypothetical protein